MVIAALGIVLSGALAEGARIHPILGLVALVGISAALAALVGLWRNAAWFARAAAPTRAPSGTF